MSLETVRDKRTEYADKLREIADILEQQPKQPIGCSLHIFFADSGITSLEKTEPGFNPLMGAGLLLRKSCEMAFGDKGAP